MMKMNKADPLAHLLALDEELETNTAPIPEPVSTRSTGILTAERIREIKNQRQGAYTLENISPEKPEYIRSYVTTRLFEESSPTQPPGQRIKALELLGKLSTVGLFADRTEVVVKSLPLEELEARLRMKLQNLMPQNDIVDVTPIYAHASND